jgi:hypothetical protein
MVPFIIIAGALGSVVSAVAAIVVGIAWLVRYIYRKGKEKEAMERDALAQRKVIQDLLYQILKQSEQPELPNDDAGQSRRDAS